MPSSVLRSRVSPQVELDLTPAADVWKFPIATGPARSAGLRKRCRATRTTPRWPIGARKARSRCGCARRESCDPASEQRSAPHPDSSQFFGTTCKNPVLSPSFPHVSLARVSLRGFGRVQGLPSAHAGRAPPRGEAGRAGRDAEWAPVGGRLCASSRIARGSHSGIAACSRHAWIAPSRPYPRSPITSTWGTRGSDLKGRPSEIESLGAGAALFYSMKLVMVARGWESGRNRLGPGLGSYQL